MVGLVGYLASLGAISMWMPHAWRVHRHRHDAGVLAGVSVLAYATAMVPNLLIAPACATVLLLGAASRRRGHAQGTRGT